MTEYNINDKPYVESLLIRNIIAASFHHGNLTIKIIRDFHTLMSHDLYCDKNKHKAAIIF
ncbi:MAG: hypothetical protein ABIG89_00045 [Candidatus Woesearchaeota archaeon]